MVLGPRARRTLLAVLPALLLASCSPARPAPSEESDLRRAREIWEEARHRTPPGVSWRQVESENRRRNLELRAALFREGAAEAQPVHWRERGSFDQTGRTHVTAVGSDGRTLFIGTDNGGVFSGLPGTRRWLPRSDGLGIGVESFVIVPGGSGSPEAWVAADLYGPLYVTTNSGLTWSPASGGPTSDERVIRLLRDPGRPRTVYALTEVSGRYRLYRSDNGGLGFRLASAGRNAGGRPDLWMDRRRGGPLYLITRQGLSLSTNRGASFQPVSSLPIPAQDAVLAGSEAGAPTLYAALRRPQASAWELFISRDAGRTWRAGSRLPDFWLTLTASMTNPRLVFAGGVHAYRSTDAGLTFREINKWGDYYATPGTRLHADIPGIDCVVYGGQEVFFFDTDGGTFLSRDGGRTVRNITRYGLGNGQYHDILTSRNDSSRIAAGSQDQGYQVSRPGSGVLGFDQWQSGDYGSLASGSGTHDMLYSAYPGFLLVQPDEGVKHLEAFNFPVDSGERRHPWIPALAADPADPGTVYFADRRIWQMDRQGPGAYTARAKPHDFGPGAEPDYVTALALSPADPDRWYAGTAYGRIWVSRDKGETWTLSRRIPSFHVSDILPSPTDPDVGYISGSGYDGTPVYRTTDGGATWEPYANGLPPTLADALAFDDPSRQELYAATDAGPYRYDEAAATWINLLGTQAPLTDYTDVEGIPAAGIVRFATYGRGIWDYSPTGHPETP